jgi:hypothetical protein
VFAVPVSKVLAGALKLRGEAVTFAAPAKYSRERTRRIGANVLLNRLGNELTLLSTNLK